MVASLEVWGPGSVALAALEHDRTLIGRDASNHIVLASDPTASRVHAIVERYAATWTVRDLDSANGTYINGEGLVGERALRDGDELRVGETRMVFRARTPRGGADVGRTVVVADDLPPITRREKDVLVALCRPVANASPFTRPATPDEIAEALVVSRAAVTFHLEHLYDKFGIEGKGPTRRVALANAALERGAITRADLLQATPPPPG